MSTILQDMMGMLRRKQIKQPKSDDVVTVARYESPQERLKPQPKVQTELVSLSSLKSFINSGSKANGQGWARYDDTYWTESNKYPLLNGAAVVIPNNAGAIYTSENNIEYYNGSTNRVLADNTNDVYIMTVVFKYQAPNANQTHLDIAFEGVNGTPYDRITGEAIFPKGNDVEHNFHQVFQYYADSSFVENGSFWQITANGGDAFIWDIIYFIQKTYNAK